MLQTETGDSEMYRCLTSCWLKKICFYICTKSMSFDSFKQYLNQKTNIFVCWFRRAESKGAIYFIPMSVMRPKYCANTDRGWASISGFIRQSVLLTVKHNICHRPLWFLFMSSPASGSCWVYFNALFIVMENRKTIFILSKTSFVLQKVKAFDS